MSDLPHNIRINHSKRSAGVIQLALVESAAPPHLAGHLIQISRALRSSVSTTATRSAACGKLLIIWIADRPQLRSAGPPPSPTVTAVHNTCNSGDGASILYARAWGIFRGAHGAAECTQNTDLQPAPSWTLRPPQKHQHGIEGDSVATCTVCIAPVAVCV